MKTRQRIDISNPLRSPCKAVTLNGDVLHWSLDQQRTYSLLDAYKSEPHRKFISSKTDAEIRAFILEWGPLITQGVEGEASLSRYRDERDVLTVAVRLIRAVQQRSNMREVLLELAQLQKKGVDSFGCIPRHMPDERRIPSSFEVVTTHPAFDIVVHDLFPGGTSDDVILEDWCDGASDAQVEELCVHLVQEFSFTCMPRFAVSRKAQGYQVVASRFINNLSEALWWMVWEDINRKKPFLHCVECGALITRPKARKFCSVEHAHRRTDREWRRKNRARKKRAKAKVNRKKASGGTR
jgi:hypothetical protein